MSDIATYCEALGDLSDVAIADLATEELACVIYAAVSIWILINEYIVSRIQHICCHDSINRAMQQMPV